MMGVIMALTSTACFPETLTTLTRQSRPVDGRSLRQARFRAQRAQETPEPTTKKGGGRSAKKNECDLAMWKRNIGLRQGRLSVASAVSEQQQTGRTQAKNAEIN